jgi:hypothetical protein
VLASTHGPTHRTEDVQDHSNDEQNHTERRQDRNAGEDSDEKQDESENDHGRHLTDVDYVVAVMLFDRAATV